LNFFAIQKFQNLRKCYC